MYSLWTGGYMRARDKCEYCYERDGEQVGLRAVYV
jgi:hypothetical protein